MFCSLEIERRRPVERKMQQKMKKREEKGQDCGRLVAWQTVDAIGRRAVKQREGLTQVRGNEEHQTRGAFRSLVHLYLALRKIQSSYSTYVIGLQDTFTCTYRHMKHGDMSGHKDTLVCRRSCAAAKESGASQKRCCCTLCK